MTTDSPHLTLAEVTVGDDPRHLPAAAASHLQACRVCQARIRHALPDGVRLLASRCEPSPGLMESVFAAIDAQSARTPRNWLARHKAGSRVALIAAAAAVVLGAASGGLATALLASSQPARPPQPSGAAATAAGLTATGCSRLELAGGSLRHVSSTDLVLAVAGGRQVTVTISASTHIIREIAGTPAEITDGAQVLVSGSATEGTIAARLVGILPLAAGVPAPRGDGLQLGIAQGTVTAANSRGFTVVERDGTRVPVTMSWSTSVITTVASSVSQLQTGKITSAVGAAGPGRTLAAVDVEQDALPPGTLKIPLVPPSLPAARPSPMRLPLPSPRPSLPAPKSLPSNAAGLPIASLGCAPAALISTDLFALGG